MSHLQHVHIKHMTGGQPAVLPVCETDHGVQLCL